MRKNYVIAVINEILSVSIVVLFGILFVVFVSLCGQIYKVKIYTTNEKIFSFISLCVISIFSISSFVCLRVNKKNFAKIFMLLIIMLGTSSVIAYYLKNIGFIDKINSVEALRSYVDGFGKYAAIVYIIIQFLQVVILPIPSVITIAAGVLIFGSMKCAVYSSIGIITGSITSFWIGKTIGYKSLSKFIGKQKIDRLLAKIKGKDKPLLTIMFLLPFFPDDLLCFVAGISSINTLFFIVMIVITRIITVFSSALSINNQLIPYNTWWGILIWCMFFILVATVWFVVYRHGDKIEKKIKIKLKKQDKI